MCSSWHTIHCIWVCKCIVLIQHCLFQVCQKFFTLACVFYAPVWPYFFYCCHCIVTCVTCHGYTIVYSHSDLCISRILDEVLRHQTFKSPFFTKDIQKKSCMCVTCHTADTVVCSHYSKCVCILDAGLYTTQFVFTCSLLRHKLGNTCTVDLSVIECQMFRCDQYAVFMSGFDDCCTLTCCQNCIFWEIFMVTCIVRCTMKVCSNTPPDCCICPQRIVTDYFTPFFCKLFAECLADYSFNRHNTHLVLTVRIILCDHTRISCRIIWVCILSQRIRVKSVRSVVLDCFRRSNRFDNLCAGSAKPCTDQAFFQSDLIHQSAPSLICNIIYTFEVC